MQNLNDFVGADMGDVDRYVLKQGSTMVGGVHRMVPTTASGPVSRTEKQSCGVVVQNIVMSWIYINSYRAWPVGSRELHTKQKRRN